MGLLSSLGDIVGGIFGSRGATRAGWDVTDQTSAAQKGLNQAYGQAQNYLNPYVQGGGGAYNSLLMAQGLKPTYGGEAGSNFFASPGYNWLKQQGMTGIQQSAAAQGGLGGNALRDLATFNNGLAAQDYNNWWDRNLKLSGLGANSANSLAQYGLNTADQVGHYGYLGGLAHAGADMSSANAKANAWNGGFNAVFGGGPSGQGGFNQIASFLGGG